MSHTLLRTIGRPAKLTLAGLFALCAILVSVSANAAEEQSYTGSLIRRPTLVVQDMNQAIALYRDILGFELGWVKKDPPTSYSYTAFNIPEGAEVMHAVFHSGAQKRVLSLLAVDGLTENTPREDKIHRAAILVNANGRLDEIRTALKENGYTVYPGHTLGTNGHEFGFLDKDGHLIAIYEFPAPK